MAASIRICALFTLALLVPGFWAAGVVYPQFDSGGGLGRMGPGFTSFGVACLTAPLALTIGGLVIAAAIRRRQWAWLAVIAVAIFAALATPPAHDLVVTPSAAAPLRTSYAPFLLFFTAEGLIALVGLLYSFTLRVP